MKSLLMLMTVLFSAVAYGKVYPNGWDHSDPPPGDEFLTNRFGRVWSEPIYKGFLFVDDHYVDAPYVVERRGFVVMVNGERVQDGADIRFVLPPPPEPAVTNDPGYPKGITKDMHVGVAICTPGYKDKRKYWDYIGLTGEARFQAELELLRSLPCVSNIVPEVPGTTLKDKVIVYDYTPYYLPMVIGSMPAFYVPPQFEDRVLYRSISDSPGQMVAILGSGRTAYVRNGGTVVEDQQIEPNEFWRWYFTVLSSDMSPQDRFNTLRTRNQLESDTLETAKGFYPLNGFHASTQLWQRLSGDMSWTNDAPTRMFALTNGWRKIEPAFMRTQMVTVATATGVPNVVQKPNVSATETNPPARVRPLAEIEPKPEHGPSGSSTIHWWFIAGLAVLAIGLVFVYKRAFRQR